MNPTALRRALYGKMSADSTLNNLLATPPSGWSKSIFYGHAPDHAGYPFVIFNKQSGVPTYANATKAAFETDVWLVKAVDQNTTADRAEAVSTRLQDLLNDAGLSISGGTEMWLRRESDVDYLEDADGERFVHSGSLYRLVVEPS
jgi:hypothetical protein